MRMSNDSFAIFGSGFGLYGYLPALVSCGQNVLLPKRYYFRFLERSELSHCHKNITWIDDEKTLITKAQGVVFALPPQQQYELAMQCLNIHSLNYFILEKPLAKDPSSAQVLLNTLINKDKTFRLGYVFRFTSWGKHIKEILQDNHQIASLTIRWQFMAYHFREHLETWKRYQHAGGGIIRFYGIQIIAVLAEIGYHNVVYSHIRGSTEYESDYWSAVFRGNNLPDCTVIIDSRCVEACFDVEWYDMGLQELTSLTYLDPFESTHQNTLGSLDQRIPILQQLYRSLFNNDVSVYTWYQAIIHLWHEVEDITEKIDGIYNARTLYS